MRRWILNLHLYGGLLCAPYLVIFGFSSLHFNHQFSFAEPKGSTVQWQAPMQVEPVPDNDAFATAIRDSLGLMGWTIPWNMKREPSGDLQFELERPGKAYTIRTSIKERRVSVEEHHKGFWQVVNSLHGSGQLPNSRFVPWWGVYTEICTWFVMAAAFSGLYLWVNSGRERRAGLLTASMAVAISLFLMIWVVARG